MKPLGAWLVFAALTGGAAGDGEQSILHGKRKC
jgi:hypothetical protein